MHTLPSDSRKRLEAVAHFSDLGSGFNIAMRDLDIRGAGNLLGGEQSGFINEIGYETYQKVLEEAIIELKETKFKELFKEDLEEKKLYVRDVTIDTDVEMLIPSEYVSNVQERLNLYTELNTLDSEEGIEQFLASLQDRFGRVPQQVHELFNGLRLQWICKELGFQRIILKNNKLRCYFVENPQSPYYESKTFGAILQWTMKKGPVQGLTFKQSQRHVFLVKDGVRSLKKAKTILELIEAGMNNFL